MLTAFAQCGYHIVTQTNLKEDLSLKYMLLTIVTEGFIILPVGRVAQSV